MALPQQIPYLQKLNTGRRGIEAGTELAVSAGPGAACYVHAERSRDIPGREPCGRVIMPSARIMATAWPGSNSARWNSR
jgi:hypothetical protein